jgi:hypothetical protein
MGLAEQLAYCGGLDMSDVWQLRHARGDRWLARVDSIEEAGRHIDNLGFVLLFPAERIEAPSLWEAVAGEDAKPFAGGMGHNETRIWQWKDELPSTGLAWYGRFLHRRSSLLSPELLAALYPGRGKETDHRTMDLPREAHDIVEALRGGALTTATLRQISGTRRATSAPSASYTANCWSPRPASRAEAAAGRRRWSS